MLSKNKICVIWYNQKLETHRQDIKDEINIKNKQVNIWFVYFLGGCQTLGDCSVTQYAT